MHVLTTRHQIYDHCLADTNTITITAAPITVFGHRIKDRARKTPIPGLPLDLAPLVKYTYDASLLSISNPATIELDCGKEANKISDELPYPAPLALLQSCRQIHAELADYMRRKKATPGKGGLSLYVTYPHGVLVLKTLYPHLLRQARNVYISGYYLSPPPPPPTSKPADDERGRGATDIRLLQSIPLLNSYFHASPPTRLRIGSPPPTPSPPRSPPPHTTLPAYPASTAELAPLALAALVKTILPSTPAPLFRKLEARILFPGCDSYRTVWSDDNGPIVQMLRNTAGGRIDMEVSRGRSGNAVVMKTEPKTGGRVVSTCWKGLGHGSEAVEGVVVGERWGEDEAQES
jgi:hypothetical protein